MTFYQFGLKEYIFLKHEHFCQSISFNLNDFLTTVTIKTLISIIKTITNKHRKSYLMLQRSLVKVLHKRVHALKAGFIFLLNVFPFQFKGVCHEP